MAKTTNTTGKDAQAGMYRRLGDLVLWEGNYNEGDVGMISLSIRRHGFANAPRVWKGNEVRGGNHTVMAIREVKRGGPQPGDNQWPPRGVLVDTDGEWLIPCIDISYLSETEATSFAIADNRAAALATQNEEVLTQYLMQIQQESPEYLEATGYDAGDLERMMQILNPITASDWNKTPDEALDFYLHGNIKQIVLYYTPEEYVQAIEDLSAIMLANGFENNTQTVTHIIQFYKEHHASLGDKSTADQSESLQGAAGG